MEQNKLQENLVAYVNAATLLAEQVRLDLRKGDNYSNETVLRLSEFVKQAEKIAKFIDILETNMRNYN